MKLQKSLATAALTALLATSAYAAPLAEANVSDAGIGFALQDAGTGSYSVVVSGPEGFRLAQDFEGTPYLSLAENALAAGLYTWTLTENRVNSGDDRLAVSYKARTQTGSFTVAAAGNVVDPNLPEGGFDKAQVFVTDLIVEGSACVGIDCTSSESFGFDTLRLKENNLRIKFEDTSASASFPGNDWQLTANDSGNGGANKFSIEDTTGGKTPFTILAGAPNNSLYVEDTGHVGIGTANPAVNAHIVEGNSPTLRLEQDGSSGFTPQTWDLAGNETNFFIRDVTNGSKLPFRIKPGAPDDSIFIAADGSVGLGTDSPDEELHVTRGSTGSTNLLVENTDGLATQLRLRTSAPSNRRIVGQNGTGTNQSQLVLADAGTIQFLGETTTSGVCLQFTDSDDNGTTACTFNDGAMTCAVGPCP